jgi:outer membrane protein assembly factor BamB
VFDGDLNVTRTAEVANEILNDMQRDAGGDKVTEDESRYQVTVHLPDAAGTTDWTGEVAGPPQLFVLKTVNVIVAGKTVVVLDKSNKMLWQASLTYPVSGGGGGFFSRRESQFGDGPCVEHGDTLYIFDQVVLTAFELGSGNARWRLPSVGVVGLFFDDEDNVYVNTTTGNPDDIKYSRQIDINRRTEAIVMKVDPKTGKTLWSAKPGGYVSYLSGKFIYVINSYDPNPTDEDEANFMMVGLQKSPFLRIARINPKNGRIMFEYYNRGRCPFFASFSDNSIQLIFKGEVQVLRFLTL